MKKFYTLVALLFIMSTAASQINHSFTFNSVDFTLSTDNENYTHLEGQHFDGFTEQEGAPKLPIITRSFVLPMGSTVTGINISTTGEVLLDGNAHIYPAQPDVVFDSIPEFVPPDTAIYNSNTPYPAETGILRSDAYTMGYHVVTVEICPFKYIPNQQKVYLYQTIDISIQYTAGEHEQTQSITRYRENLSKETVGARVLNPELIATMDGTAETTVEETNETDKLLMHWLQMGDVPDYLIITNEELKPVFQELAEYKIKRGIPALVVTTEQIYARFPGVDKAEKIRNYLKAAHRSWGNGLFVLLGGDTEIIPGRIASYDWGEKSPSDLYYSDVYKQNDPNYNWNANGNAVFGEDYVNGQYNVDGLELGYDNFIGRAPVKNTTEAHTFLEKVINYEKLDGVSDKSYVNNMLFVGAYYSYNSGEQTGSPGGQKWQDAVANEEYIINNQHNPNLKVWKLYDHHLGAPPSDPDYFGNEELTDTDFLNRLSNGEETIGQFHLISHYDHGSPFGVGSSNRMKGLSVYREDMDNLSNGNYLQIMYTTGCAPGKFTLDAWAEHYINNPNGGGVGIIANSESVSSTEYGVDQTKALFQSIYGEIEGHPNSYLLGVAFANTRDAYDRPQRKKVLTLFGDPSLATWSATPGSITLSAPASITISNTTDNTFTVNINALDEDALITLYKYNEISGFPDVFAKQTITKGNTSAEFILHPDTPGRMLITATAKNHLPATAQSQVQMPLPHLYVTGYKFEDENENGIIEPGEKVTLSLDITNSGGAAINDVQAVLSTHSGIAVIDNGTQGHTGFVNPGQTITLEGFTFTMSSSPNMPIFDFVRFLADITGTNGYEHKDDFYIEQKGAELTLGKRTVTDSSGEEYSGSFPAGTPLNLDIVLHNTGATATGILSAELTSPATGIQITTDESSYPNIEANAEERNTTHFVFKLNSGSSGLFPFKLTLTNEFGKEWEFEFNLNENCPGLIADFDFTSGTDQINLMWPPVQDIGGYSIYRSDTENGTYEKMNDFLLVGTSAYTDYQLEEDTEYYYKISVVSLSGQECPLDDLNAFLAWTSKKNKEGFPVHNSNIREGYSSPIVYDVNKDGNKEIFLNYRRGNHDKGIIMGLKHNGQELFDIDNDPETVSGFALTEIALVSNSAVGDIDNDGFAEVVSAGRNHYTHEGRLYVYKTVDLDQDGKPDPFWGTEYLDLEHRAYRNPVLYDLDNDGYLDIIVADEEQRIHVFDHNGDKKPGWPIKVGDADYSEGELAVADLDGDGFGEIIFGVKKTGEEGEGGGIFIFNHDGTSFVNPTNEEPVVITFDPGERLDGGITIADIDNDGYLDILFIVKNGNKGRIYAVNRWGKYLADNWDGSYSGVNINNANNKHHIIPRISVGDLDGDGNLEIVFGSKDKLYVLDNEGYDLPGFPINDVGDIDVSAPVLADIDGDSNIEIIVNLTKGPDNFLQAFKLDGTICEGWPVYSEGFNPFVGSPAVADIDNDGLNEIIISAEDGTTYVWETSGSADRIEWGMHRADSHNTGAYKSGCRKDLDLYIKDSPRDLGIEPNTFTDIIWNTDDIWVRNTDDGGLLHQNPVYNSNEEPNYINIRIRNKGCSPSSGSETLTVNWAKSATNLPYPVNWDGSMLNDSGFELGEQVVGTPVSIPIIQPGEEAIVTIPWVVPDPTDYPSELDNENPWHYGFLATILSLRDPLVHAYTENPGSMVRENNNQAWKNLTAIELVPGGRIGGTTAVLNHHNSPKSFDLALFSDSEESTPYIFEEAEVTVIMDTDLYNAWVAGGEQLSGGIYKKLLGSNTLPVFQITGNDAKIKNVTLDANESGHLAVRFNMLTKKLTSKPVYIYHLTQMDRGTDEIMGGESYEIRKPPRSPFYADADDVLADRNEMVTLTAESINEAAVYNWYDEAGELIYTGTEMTVIADIAKTYKLEIIADADGYKDYTDVNVELNPHKLKNIVPNPASQNVAVSYNLNAPASAYLSILGYIGNDTGVERNYILDTESSQYTVDLTGYAIGFYTVRLVCDGQLVGTLNLIKD